MEYETYSVLLVLRLSASISKVKWQIYNTKVELLSENWPDGLVAFTLADVLVYLTLSPWVATAVDYTGGRGRRLPSTTALNAAGDRCRQLFFSESYNHYICTYTN